MKVQGCSICCHINSDNSCRLFEDKGECINSNYKFFTLKEKQMNKVIFESEELARGIFNIAITSIEIKGNSEDNFITSLRCSGYIRKSAVEEAEEMYKEWSENNKCNDIEMAEIIHKQYNAIQELKAENERLR